MFILRAIAESARLTVYRLNNTCYISGEVESLSRKRVTSFDVAKLAGVSRSVVSAVLNDTQGIGVSSEKREAVLAAIRELNYHVDAQARAMKTGQSRSIAAFGDIRNPLFLQVLEGMQRTCGERGYHLLISGQGGQEEGRSELIKLFLARKIDGIVSLDKVSYADEAWLEEVRQSRVPYVSVEGYAETAGVVSVLADYRRSVTDLLDILHPPERGGELPVYIQLYHGGSRENWAERGREEAYRDWCAARGADPVIFPVEERRPDAVLTLVQDLAQRSIGIPVLLCNWSAGAIAVYRAAHTLGLEVGRAIRVAAADNTLRAASHLVPRLSAMEIPYVRMGEQAVTCLLEMLEGHKNVREIDAPGGFRTREEGVAPAGDGAESAQKYWLYADYLPGESC